MKIKLKKPVCHNEVFWNAGAVIEAEKNWAQFAVGIGDAELAGDEDELTPLPELAPERKSLETEAMEKAATSIVQAVAKAATGEGKGRKAKDDLV